MRKGEGSSTTDHILVMKHCTHDMALDISFAGAGAGAPLDAHAMSQK